MNKQKIFSKLLSIVLVMTMFLSNIMIITNTMIGVSAVSGDFFNGDGSEDNPYQISTAEQLNNVSKYLGENTYFKLINDINLTEFIAENNPINGWLPIGDYFNKFEGHFDGAGYTIKGLWISRSSDDFIGLFSCLGRDSSISNLGVEISSKGVSGNCFVGGLTGGSDYKITNSYATGSVNGVQYVGGLVGSSIGQITNSYATGSVNGVQYVGGLTGGSDNKITNSYATGSVNGVQYVGGLVGYSHRGIESSYATGSVRGENIVGGLVGDNNNATIKSSYATGSVDANRAVGGLAGWNTNGTIKSCYFNTTTTNQENGIGVNYGSETVDIIDLTTIQMIASNSLTEHMSSLGDEWSKRNKTDDVCYYPELKVFYSDGELDTLSKQASEASVRVARKEISGGTLAPTEIVIVYESKLGGIKAGYAYHTIDELSLVGTIRWDDGDETIPEVSNPAKSYSGTFIPDNDLYKSVENVSVKITVTPMVITIMPTENQSKEYGASDPTFKYTTSETLIKGNTITGKLSRNSGETVGTYAYTLGSLSINNNYKLLLDETNKFEITKATSTITLEATPTSGEASYGEDNVTLNVTVHNSNTSIETESPTGTITVTVNNGTPQAYKLTNGSTSLQLTLGVGKHTIEVDYSGDDYYKSGEATINNYDVNKANQENLTITNIPETITYGDTFNLTTEGGSGDGNTTWSITEGSEYASIDSAKGKVIIIGVGTIKVKATKETDNDYNETYAEASFTSNKKEVSIAGTIATNKEYDGTTNATIDSLGTINGLLPSDKVNVSIDTTYTVSFKDKTAGDNKTVTINGLTLTGTKADNYKLNSTSYETTATIYQKELTITEITVQDKTYDGTTTATIGKQGTLVGIVDNDDVGIETIANFQDSNVGTDKAIDVTITSKGGDIVNYTIAQPMDIKASITPKALTIKPDSNQSKFYREVDPILTYQATGAIEGDTIEFAGALERTIGEEKGAYVINQGSLISKNSNYTIQFSDGVMFTINAKETTPITGDNTNIILYVVLLAFSSVVIINRKKPLKTNR